MVSKLCNVSLKRQRPFPDSSRNASQEPSEVSLIEFTDLGLSSTDLDLHRPFHLQGSSDSDGMMPKSRSNRSCFTPRPLIVSILNNKGVICMKRQQYEDARKCLNRALKLAEKEDQQTNGKDEANTCAEAIIPAEKNGINMNTANNITCMNEHKHFESEPRYYFKVEHSIGSTIDDNKLRFSSSTGREASTTSSVNSATVTRNSSAPHTPSKRSDDREARSPMKTCTTDQRQSRTKDFASKTLQSARQINPTKSEYDEGMDCFKSPLRLMKNSLSLSGTILFNLGHISNSQGEFEDALRLYKRSLLTIEKCSSRDEALTMAVLMGIGKIHYVKGDYTDSLNVYMTALSLSQSYFEDNSLEVAACLNCIGVLHYMMPTGDDDVALDTLQTSLHYRIKLLGKDHIDVGTTWNNVGRVYFQLGKLNLAMEAYCEALRIRRKCQGESVDVAATLFNCGQVYHNLQSRDKALALFQEFLKLAKIHLGEFHRDICIVTTCIGQVLHESKDYENALKSFQHALRIGHVALGPLHSEMAITLNKMGNLYYETGDFDSALSAYNRGLEIEIAVLETGNPNTYVTYTNIAEIYKQKGDFVQAMEYYQKVYELQLDNDADTIELANTLSNVGYTKQQLEDLDGALEANQECLRLRRDAYGDTHEDVASILSHIALVLLKLERHDIALQVFMEAYRIRRTIPFPDTSNLAFTIYNIAHIYHHQGSHDNALKCYLATAEIEKGLGIANLELSITYYNIGLLFYQRGDMELALVKFNEALSIERECYGANHPTCARTLNEIGNIEMQLGNLEGMMKCYTKALRIYKEAGMVDEPVIVHSLRLWRFNIDHPESASVA